jgi:Bacterial SH3 domain/PEGA domain
MRRKIGFLLGLIALVALVAFVVRALSSRGPKQGELRVDSVPVASVFLDNKNIGKTPYKEKVDAGSYTLKLVPDSATAQLTSWQGKVDVGQNLLTYVNAALSESELSSAIDVVWLEKITSKKSELSVTTSPDGATVLVDDATKGLTPLTLQDIAPGDHTVSITSTGFLTRTLKIKTTPGYRVIANLKLALVSATPTPEASPTGSITPAPTGKTTPTPKISPTKAATSSANTVTPPKPYVIIKDTPTGFLRVRMEPSTGATEAGRVNPGEKYTILDSDNGWYQIRYDNSNTGWVSGQYTEKVE